MTIARKRVMSCLIAAAMTLSASVVSVNAASITTPKISINSETNTITWSKVSNVSGYYVFSDNKTNTTKDNSYAVSKTGTYSVAAYRTVKAKYYWNSKSRKWVTKKPAKKYYKKCSRKSDAHYKKKCYTKCTTIVSARSNKIYININSASNTDVNSEQAVKEEAATGSGTISDQMLNLVNQERTNTGVKALAIDDAIQKTAQAKAEDMYNNKYFAHESPTLGQCWNQYDNNGISWYTAGENIAMGQTSVKSVMSSWMNSAGHKANILNSRYTRVGFGYYKGYWVQQFAV